MDNQIIYGTHAVAALLTQSPSPIKLLYLQQDILKRLQSLQQLAERQHVAIKLVTKSMLDQLTEQNLHQGVAAQLLSVQSKTLPEVLDQLAEPPFLLILDEIQDPHNLGACLRSANAAGVHAVIAPKDRAVGMTGVVRKVASGAAEITPFIQVTNLARTLAELKQRGIWVYGAAEEGQQSIYAVDLRGPLALVLGSEGSGLRRLTRDSCDQLIHIPTVGSVSSLNVSVATGICLFEALRQRQLK